MSDPKLWTDLVTSAWLLWSASLMTTENMISAMLFKFLPLLLAFLLAMSHAKAFF